MKSCLGQHDGPRGHILSKISQIEKDILCDFTDTENLKAERTNKTNETEQERSRGLLPSAPHHHVRCLPFVCGKL